MEHKRALLNLRNELVFNFDDRIARAVAHIVDKMLEADCGNISLSNNNIGIDITDSSIAVVDIETGKYIAVLTLDINKEIKQ